MKKPKGWITPTTSDYYGEYEELKGIPKDAKKVQVLWPNGAQTVEKLEGRLGKGSAQVDMNGYPDHFPTLHYYVKVKHFGLEIYIRVKELAIKPV